MGSGDFVDGTDMTAVYLVSSFGFAGSPGEWTVWGQATEMFLRAHCPAIPRRDLSWNFESRVLVAWSTTMWWLSRGLVCGWVAAEVYEAGVQKLLGKAAVKREKDLIEGPFRAFQTVWGLDIETSAEEVRLPERRILKGTSLLAEPCFEYCCKDLTLRTVQRFRWITTGWVVIVKGSRNELKAADRFLGAEQGAGRKCSASVTRRRSMRPSATFRNCSKLRGGCARGRRLGRKSSGQA